MIDPWALIKYGGRCRENGQVSLSGQIFKLSDQMTRMRPLLIFTENQLKMNMGS